MQAVAFWTIIAEHCCIFEKLCKSLSVPKTNKMWAGRAHEVSVRKERKNKPQTNQKEKHFAKMSAFEGLSKRRICLKMKNKLSEKLTM